MKDEYARMASHSVNRQGEQRRRSCDESCQGDTKRGADDATSDQTYLPGGVIQHLATLRRIHKPVWVCKQATMRDGGGLSLGGVPGATLKTETRGRWGYSAGEKGENNRTRTLSHVNPGTVKP